MARATDYNKEIVDEICEEIATTNKGIATILSQKEEYPSEKTFFNWLNNDDNKEFLQLYARAKERQAERLASEIIAIADDSREDTETRYDQNGAPYEVENKEYTNRSRLRVDTRKWIMSKLLPKKFGDKVDLTSDGKQLNQEPIVFRLVKPDEE